jgi:hypothetical protein
MTVFLNCSNSVEKARKKHFCVLEAQYRHLEATNSISRL